MVDLQLNLALQASGKFLLRLFALCPIKRSQTEFIALNIYKSLAGAWSCPVLIQMLHVQTVFNIYKKKNSRLMIKVDKTISKPVQLLPRATRDLEQTSASLMLSLSTSALCSGS